MDVDADFGDCGGYDDVSVEVEVPTAAGKMDVLAAVASVLPASPTTVKTTPKPAKGAAVSTSKKPAPRYDDDEEEKEAEFDENEHTASSSGDSSSSDDSSDSSSSSSGSDSDSGSSGSGLSDTDSETEQRRRKTPLSHSKKRALHTSSRESSPERPVKKKSSPAGTVSRELASLQKETNPPPRAKPESPPSAKKSSPKAKPSQAKSTAKSASSSSSSSSKSGSKLVVKAVTKAPAGSAAQVKEKMDLLLSAKSDEEDVVEVLMWISSQVHARTSLLQTSFMSIFRSLAFFLFLITRYKLLLSLIGGDAASVDFIPRMRSLGATAFMVEMLRKHHTYSEFVTWKVLVALNNIVFKDCAETTFLVGRGLIELLLPLCAAESKRIRLQTLWIIGNAAVQSDGDIEAHVLTTGVVEAIVKVCLRSGFLLCTAFHLFHPFLNTYHRVMELSTQSKIPASSPTTCGSATPKPSHNWRWAGATNTQV